MKTLAKMRISSDMALGKPSAVVEYAPQMSVAQRLLVAVTMADALHDYLTKICTAEGLKPVTEMITQVVQDGYEEEGGD